MTAVRRLIGLTALSALVVMAAPTAGAQTSTVTSVIGSADGLSVDLTITPFNVAPSSLGLGPLPTVTLPPEGGNVSEVVLGVDESVGIAALTAATLRTSAEGELGPAGFATAESVVEELALAIVGSASVLEAEVISATCSANLDGVTGATTLAGASVLGTALEVNPAPNTQLVVTLPGVGEVSLTLNRQVTNPDGSLSVTALALAIDVNVVEAIDISGTLEIGPATCGVLEGPLPAAASAQPAPAQPVAAQARFTG